jgi:hypothetical protein
MVNSDADAGENQGAEPGRDDLLHLDLDFRLISLWSDAWEIAELNAEQFGAFLRFAYGMGYRDALTERERGKLYRDHGYSVPERRR